MCNTMVTELGIHSIRAHPKSDMYVCPNLDCTYTSCHRHRVRLHNATVHHGFKKFKCPKCKFRGSQRSDIVRHLSVHSNEKKFSCPVCQKAFKRETSIPTHIRKMHSEAYAKIRPFRCPVCMLRYTNKANLVNHIVKEHI